MKDTRKTIHVSPELHRKLMTRRIRYGFRSLEEMLKVMLELLDKHYSTNQS